MFRNSQWFGSAIAILVALVSPTYAQIIVPVPFPELDHVHRDTKSRSFGFSTSGDYFWALTQSQPTHLIVWNAKGRKSAWSIELDRVNYNCAVAWNANDSAIAVAGDRSVALYSVATGKQLTTFSLDDKVGRIAQVAFAAENRFLLVQHELEGKCYAVTILDGKDGKQIKQIKTSRHRGDFPSLGVSPDGLMFATIGANDEGDDSLKFWETATGKLLGSVGPRAANSFTLCFLPDGKRLVTFHSTIRGNGEGEFKVWDVSRPQEPTLSAAIDREGGVGNIFLAGKQLAFANHDCRSWTLWNEQWKIIREVTDAALIDGAACSPDGKTLISGTIKGGGVQLWTWAESIVSGNAPRLITELGDKNFKLSKVYHLAVTADRAHLILIGQTNRFQPLAIAFDHKTGKIERKVLLEQTGTDAFRGFDPSTGRVFLIGRPGFWSSQDKEAALPLVYLDIATGKFIQILDDNAMRKLFPKRPYDVRVTVDAEGRRFLLWNTQEDGWYLFDQDFKKLLTGNKRVHDAFLSPGGGRFMIFDVSRNARLFDGTTGKEIIENDIYSGLFLDQRRDSVAIFSDGKNAIVSTDSRSIGKLSFATKKIEYPIVAHASGAMRIQVTALAFDPESQLLAVGSNSGTNAFNPKSPHHVGVRVYDADSGLQRFDLPPGALVSRLAFADKGKTLYAVIRDSDYSLSRLVVWDLGRISARAEFPKGGENAPK